MPLDAKLLIDGELVAGEKMLAVINPATGVPFTEVPRASREQAGQAVAAALAAQPKWAALGIDARRAKLLEFADAVRDNRDELARTLVQEQGKPLAEATAEITYAEAFIRYFAGLDVPVQVLEDTAASRVEVHRKPLGVVVGITPWNLPVLIASYKIAPALLLGNTLVLKPAPTTPVTTLMLGALASRIFPKGVLNVVADDNDLGPFLTEHKDVSKVSFTGSTPTGRKVMASAASTLKRLTLELGGNDAGIVLGDVDVKQMAPRIFGAAFFNAGQVCIALKRVYAHSAIYDALCDELSSLASTLVVGDGLAEGTTLGPVQNKAQFEKAKQFLADAAKDGRVIAGGRVREGGGYFIEPTIVRDIANGASVVAEEQFAPILPIIRFDDLDQVIEDANGTEYGLGGSVWSADSQRAYEIAQRMNTGTVWVNQHCAFGPHIPMAGAKQSGIGVELGQAGLGEFSQTTVFNIAK